MQAHFKQLVALRSKFLFLRTGARHAGERTLNYSASLRLIETSVLGAIQPYATKVSRTFTQLARF